MSQETHESERTVVRIKREALDVVGESAFRLINLVREAASQIEEWPTVELPQKNEHGGYDYVGSEGFLLDTLTSPEFKPDYRKRVILTSQGLVFYESVSMSACDRRAGVTDILGFPPSDDLMTGIHRREWSRYAIKALDLIEKHVAEESWAEVDS